MKIHNIKRRVMSFNKLKCHFSMANGISSKVKRQAIDWKMIFVTHLTKGLMSTYIINNSK